MNKFQQIFCLLSAGALLPSGAVASVIYNVTANTSSISGQSIFLDLQFEPGPVAVNLATATVTGFTSNGTLTGTATKSGDVTGQLPGPVTFDNQTVFNDYFQGDTAGTTLSFTVTLNGPTPLGGGPSAFNIAFYAADGATPLLTNSPDGIAGQITLNGNGTTSVMTFPTATGGAPVLSITSPVATPEPATLAMTGLSVGLLSFQILGRRRRNVIPLT